MVNHAYHVSTIYQTPAVIEYVLGTIACKDSTIYQALVTYRCVSMHVMIAPHTRPQFTIDVYPCMS